MPRHIILVSSITYAIKGRDLLRKQGLHAYVERKTNGDTNNSCGYVIIVNGNIKKIVSVLSDAGIKILDIKTVA